MVKYKRFWREIMKKKFVIRQNGYVDVSCQTRPLYRLKENGEYEFIGFENGLKPHQLVDSTRKWYQDRANRAILQADLFAS